MARIGRAAFLLGFAGLLPQVLAVAGLMVARWQPSDLAPGPFASVALIYAIVILSFLGGIWWGFAMRRGEGQGRLAAIAVVPSLAALALLATLAFTGRYDWTTIAIGSAILLTLLVDRRLVSTGEAPAGWMRLRVPLSAGLGGLTILAGILVGNPATPF